MSHLLNLRETLLDDILEKFSNDTIYLCEQFEKKRETKKLFMRKILLNSVSQIPADTHAKCCYIMM